MQILKPIPDIAGFLKAFDNGGFFWNLWSRSGDGVISSSEIAKGGRRLAADRTAILHFELLRSFLPAAEAERALGSLDRPARARWKKHEPARGTVAEVVARPAGDGVIFEAALDPAEDAAGAGIRIHGMMMIGTAVVPTRHPISAHYRLWHLRDGRGAKPRTLLATAPKSLDPGPRRLRIAALVHESPEDPPAGKARPRCLIGIAACAVPGGR